MTDSGSGSGSGSSPGSGSAFVHVSPALDRESSFPYAPHSHHWLTTHAFLITALLDLDEHQHGIAYPPTTPQQRRALLNAAPTPLARAQATYYLLRDRALTQAEPEAHIHPAALAWAANNTLTLSPRQRTLIDALWLIDHAHLEQGTDSLIQLITNTSKASPLHNTLPHHAIHQLFFRLAAHAADERLHPNHVPAPPPAAKRLVTFVQAFHHAGIGQLFAQVNNASSQEQQQLPRQALEAYLISLCRVKGLRETWNWLNQRYGDADAYQSPSSTESIYASLLISVIQSIATPNPLRSQLFEVVYLPLSPSDLQIFNGYAIAVPSTRSSTTSNPSTSRKARAILAEVLFIRYIQSGRYADALALDAQLELQSAHFDPALFDSAHPNSMDGEGEAHQIDARRKRRADLLRAARDVMPEVQRALLDVRRVRNAVDAAGTGTGPVHKKSSTSTNTADDRSWHDVTQEDVSGEGRDDEMELDMDVDVDVGTPPAPTTAEHDIVPLTSSAALRGTVPLEKAAAADLSTRSSATAAAVVHASDPQAALISALVSNSVDSASAGAGAGRKSQRHRASFDVSLSSAGFRARQSIGGRSSPLGGGGGGGGSISRQSPGPGANATPIRSSPFGLRARSSLAGGAPSPSSFGTPRRSTSTLDLAGDPGAGAIGRSERSGSPGMHLAYLFRQPERRFVASVDIPLVSAGGAGAGAGGGDVLTERWAAEQNLRMMDTDDDVIPEHVLQETPMQERDGGRNENENDAANRTLKRSGRATGNGGAGDDDADTSVRMPGAWDAPEEPSSSSSTNNNARGLKKRGTGAGAAGGLRVRGDPSGEEGLSGGARVGAKSKRGRKAVGTGSDPASSEAEVQPGPTSSTPAARRTTNALVQPSQQKQARNPRARAPPPPSGLRRMTRASSVLSSTSTSSSVVEGSADDEMRGLSDDEVGEVVNEMVEVEVEGGGIPVVLRRRVARATATATATAKRVVSGTTATGAGAGTRRSNRLTSTEPGEGEEGASASQSETETETAGEGEGEGDEVGSQVDESEGESVGGRRRTRRAGAKKVATGTTRSKGKKRV
ncbi:unnamed protein product [Tilletia controversa]|nr:unnamed protein product [Tilletia controversa]